MVIDMDILPQATVPENSELFATKVQQLKKQATSLNNISDKQLKQAKKVSQDFEALFVGMMIKSMRETVPQKNSLTGGGHGEEVYRSLLDQEYATASVKRGGLGLAKQIEREIIRQETGKPQQKIDTHQ